MKCPSFAYPGGKHYQRKWLLEAFPSDVGGCYCEPFAGRGNVFWLAVSEMNCSGWWLNDLYASDFLSALRNHTEDELRQAIGEKYPSRDEYSYLCGEKSLRSILCEPWITFSGGGWRQGYRHGPKAPTVKGYIDRILAASKILKCNNVKITASDYQSVLSSLGDGDFAYVDPPYFGCDVRSYAANDISHSALVESLVVAKYRWVLSEYEQPFYNEVFGPPAAKKSETLKVSGKLVSAEERVEVIYKNF